MNYLKTKLVDFICSIGDEEWKIYIESIVSKIMKNDPNNEKFKLLINDIMLDKIQ